MLLFLYFMLLPSISYGFTEETTFYKNMPVYSYRNFGSVQTFSIDIPPDTFKAVWNVSVNRSQTKCYERMVFIYAQYGSFPVEKFDGNETFTDKFLVNRTGLLKDNVTHRKTIEFHRPVYGQWFLGGVMERSNNEVIKKLDLSVCDHGLESNITFYIGDVSILLANSATTIRLYDNITTYYKFLTTRTTYKYRVTISNCKQEQCNFRILFKSKAIPNTDDNSSEANNNSHYITIYGAAGNNNNSQNDINILANNDSNNIKNDSYLEVFSPSINSWQYIAFVYDGIGAVFDNSSIEFDALVSLYGNSVYQTIFNEADSLFIPRPSLVTMTTFDVDVMRDVGGTLVMEFTLIPLSLDFQKSPKEFQAAVCIQRDYPTVTTDNRLHCRDPGSLIILNDNNSHHLIYVPYPESGIYYIGFQEWTNESFEDVKHRGSVIEEERKMRSGSGGVGPGGEGSATTTTTNPLERMLKDREVSVNELLRKVLVTDGLRNVSHYELKDPSMGVLVSAHISSCLNKQCENNGVCRFVEKGPYYLSFCVCSAGFNGFFCENNSPTSERVELGLQGFLCQDKSNMVSYSLQMWYTVMLTCSNLAFIPAMIIAFKRWRFIEFCVYTLNMVFSTFYHACDMSAWSVYGFCVVRYSVHKYSDFLLSLLSFWVTLLAMTRIKSGKVAVVVALGVVVVVVVCGVVWCGVASCRRHLLTLLTVGIVMIAIFVNSSNEVWTNVVPIATGSIVVIIAWVWKGVKSRSLFPDKLEYRWMVPGILLALLGIVVFAFLENDTNYPYTHSFWHIAVASCVPFLLPRKKSFWELVDLEETIKISSSPVASTADGNTFTFASGGESSHNNDDDEVVLFAQGSSFFRNRQAGRHAKSVANHHHQLHYNTNDTSKVSLSPLSSAAESLSSTDNLIRIK
ncbi:hypothetical protein HELRODRAFT_194137 [Helobdella robusta]|uniref:EGF-like domain-containing protein n=1 Tax=Helobdella robusta TaxID=6412 RepID=T1FVQ8_HELRO|nr:hypothetical protein HELRODRAFT_194137 [Helobdella robusta]ESN93339.1 hypothetical protein HELRODRAFT_194137 [Helobdella robusta]